MLATITAFVLLLAVAFTLWVATGTPVRWTKGIVHGDLCVSTEADYLCRVELVPDGSHVMAASGSDIAKGTWVELRVWHNFVSGKDTYTVVR
jgi:hypothetical protein